jgi:hypothetical protein
MKIANLEKAFSNLQQSQFFDYELTLRTLSFLRKQESVKNVDSCFRRNDSGTG